MKRKLAWFVFLAAFISSTANALATIEFLKMKSTEQYDVIEPIVISFVQRGFKKVPDNNFTLISAVRKLALEKGYTYQNIENVAEEAAIRLGMHR